MINGKLKDGDVVYFQFNDADDLGWPGIDWGLGIYKFDTGTIYIGPGFEPYFPDDDLTGDNPDYEIIGSID